MTTTPPPAPTLEDQIAELRSRQDLATARTEELRRDLEDLKARYRRDTSAGVIEQPHTDFDSVADIDQALRARARRRGPSPRVLSALKCPTHDGTPVTINGCTARGCTYSPTPAEIATAIEDEDAAAAAATAAGSP